MSAPFGARRETLSQQLTRIEASRPARRDTSGVVAISDPLGDFLASLPVPAFGGLTAARFLAEHRRECLASARWSDGAWLAGETECGPDGNFHIDCNHETLRFERLPRDHGRGTAGEIGTLADWPGLSARVEAARVETARRRIERRYLHRIFLDDAPLAECARPDLRDAFGDDIAAAVAVSDEAPRRSPINWLDLPQDEDSRLSAGEIALGLSWFAAACGLAWCFYRLFVLVAEVW